jgi:peroxiredoxin
MIPHERSLVEKMQGKPFALLGVNTDTSIEEVKSKSKEKGVTWRSWFDGQSGPICKQYKVQSFPTIFVLDHKGVVRYKNVRGEKMDEAVETLIKELEDEKKAGG